MAVGEWGYAFGSLFTAFVIVELLWFDLLTMQTVQGGEGEGGGGKECCLVLFSDSVLRRHPGVEISGA